MSKSSVATLLIYPPSNHLLMITGTHINAALFITPPVFPPQTPDFVERERESLSAGEAEERRRKGRGARDEGRL